jgi:hypothetical protein
LDQLGRATLPGLIARRALKNKCVATIDNITANEDLAISKRNLKDKLWEKRAHSNSTPAIGRSTPQGDLLPSQLEKSLTHEFRGRSSKTVAHGNKHLGHCLGLGSVKIRHSSYIGHVVGEPKAFCTVRAEFIRFEENL